VQQPIRDAERRRDLAPTRLLDPCLALDFLVVVQRQQAPLQVLKLAPRGQYLVRRRHGPDDPHVLGLAARYPPARGLRLAAHHFTVRGLRNALDDLYRPLISNLHFIYLHPRSAGGI
jgi:hypothetical protein